MLKRPHSKIPQKYLKNIGIVLSLGVCGILLLSPFSLQAMGNVFFGKVPALYNVTLAQFFFRQSSSPLFGKAAPYAHYQLSRTYFIQGNLMEAVDEAEKELMLYPDHVRTYYILGLTYGYLNQEKKAIEMFSKFIEANSISWAARNDQAWLQFRIGDIDGALATIEPIAYDTNNPWVQNTYGTLLMNKKKYAQAKTAFLNAKKIVDTMTEESWGRAYPGNDPRIYRIGLNAMKLSIESNLNLLANK
jgi:tetratricopeptide (TPR) repeat protein